jgi:hypothetical protein
MAIMAVAQPGSATSYDLAYLPATRYPNEPEYFSNTSHLDILSMRCDKSCDDTGSWLWLDTSFGRAQNLSDETEKTVSLKALALIPLTFPMRYLIPRQAGQSEDAGVDRIYLAVYLRLYPFLGSIVS